METKLADIPEECIASILGFTSPRDVKRLALVNKAFLRASRSNLVWESMLPPHWQQILPDSQGLSREKIHDALRQGVYSQGEDGNNKEFYVVDQHGITRMLAPKAMTIIWIDDSRYWEYRPSVESRFGEVAYLKAVCWLELRGCVKGYWWPGGYTVLFRYRLNNGWVWNVPVKLNLSVGERVHPQRSCLLLERGNGVRKIRGDWREVEAGDFVVETAGEEIEINVSLTEIDGGHWKSGLSIEGIVIRPKPSEEEEEEEEAEEEEEEEEAEEEEEEAEEEEEHEFYDFDDM